MKLILEIFVNWKTFSFENCRENIKKQKNIPNDSCFINTNTSNNKIISLGAYSIST